MKKSYIIAIAFSALLVLWMLSGLFADEQADAPQSPRQETETFTVKVQEMRAQTTQLLVTAQGQALPNRMVNLRAQTQGQVLKLHGQEGQKVSQGQAIVEIDMQDRLLQLDQQKALLAAHRKTHERTLKLQGKQFQAEGELEQAFANLKASEAAVANIQRDITNTKIVAPFAGTLEKHLVEQGDFVQVNTVVAVLVENDPLLVSIPVAQQDIGKVSLNAEVSLAFATGDNTTGKISYISPRADATTRTFEVEIVVPNTQPNIPSGVSVEAKIPVGEVSAHYLSLALLSLNDAGEIGIKTVTDNGVVEFYPVDILSSDTQGAWVSGMPMVVRVITTGQGFVKAGNRVKTVMD